MARSMSCRELMASASFPFHSTIGRDCHEVQITLFAFLSIHNSSSTSSCLAASSEFVEPYLGKSDVQFNTTVYGAGACWLRRNKNRCPSRVMSQSGEGV